MGSFLEPDYIDLQTRSTDGKQAVDLRSHYTTFVEDWDSLEMSVYDNCPTVNDQP